MQTCKNTTVEREQHAALSWRWQNIVKVKSITVWLTHDLHTNIETHTHTHRPVMRVPIRCAAGAESDAGSVSTRRAEIVTRRQQSNGKPLKSRAPPFTAPKPKQTGTAAPIADGDKTEIEMCSFSW